MALSPAVIRAYLGGLAHLLLELSSHAIVFLNAQRERLGRFLRLQLRLVREKRKENNDLKLGVPSHKPAMRTGRSVTRLQ